MTATLYPLVVPQRHPLSRLRLLRSLLPAFLSLAVYSLSAQVCNNQVSISLDEDCSELITPDMVLEGTYDFDNFVVTLETISGISVPNPVNASHLGHTYIATVTDTTLNSSCWGYIVIEDNLPPQIQCVNLSLPCLLPDFSPEYLVNELDIVFGQPAVFDNCSNPVPVYSDNWEYHDCLQPELFATLTRTWTVEDPSGNQNQCTQTIKVEYVHPEDIQFPADQVQECTDPETSPYTTGFPYWEGIAGPVELSVETSACGFTLNYNDQILPACGAGYTILRTWTLWNACPIGGTAPIQELQIIKVLDTEGPELICPADVTVNSNPFTCNKDLDLPDIHLMDACSNTTEFFATWKQDGVVELVEGSLTDFPGNNYWIPDTMGVLGIATGLPIGDIVMTYNAVDECHNVGTCSFIVSVRDLSPPLAACDEFTAVNIGGNGEVLINATTFDDGSWDNCGITHFKAKRVDNNSCQSTGQFHDQVLFCCEDVGDTVSILLRVYDFPVAGGSVSLTYGEPHNNDCLVKAIVRDKIKPACLPPEDVVAECSNFDPSFWLYGQAEGADNCCVDTLVELNPNYAQFDTICNRGTLVRRFQVTDCNGLSNNCTQRVIIENEQFYYLKFPDDLLITNCDTMGEYGPGPELFGVDCELISISREDEVFESVPEACVKIERTWTVINWCHYDPNKPMIIVPNPTPHPEPNNIQNLEGPIVAPPGNTPASTLIRVNPQDSEMTDYTIFWDKEANGYQYKQIINIRDSEPPWFRSCPLTFQLEFCDDTDNDPNFYNGHEWAPIGNPEMTDLCEDGVNLAVTASDFCSGGNVNLRYLLFLDLDGDDSTETVVSSTNLPGFNTIYYNNVNTPNYEGGTPLSFDHRPVPPEQKYGFALEIWPSMTQVTGLLKWNTAANPNSYVNPILPHGTHRILWIAEDKCGNVSYCEYIFTIRDCLNPEIVCLNGLSVNIQPSSDVTIYPNDLIFYINDNCTPNDDLRISMVPSTQGATTFPEDPNGDPFGSVSFTCSDVGTQDVQIWVQDAEENESLCETYVIVQDNLGMCLPGSLNVAGYLFTEDEEGLEDATVTEYVMHPSLPIHEESVLTDPFGFYDFNFNIPLSSNVQVIPFKDDNHINGVTTFDLVLINQHILGQEPLDSPYKMIAADANKSGSITSYDVVEFRKLLLGVYSELPENTSWRFVDADFSFPTPNNPFATPFPESITLLNLQADPAIHEFIAVKIGDVNDSALSSNNALSSEDRNRERYPMPVRDVLMQKGESVRLEFSFEDFIHAAQFSMNLGALQIASIDFNGPIDSRHLAMPAEGWITLAWNRPLEKTGKATVTLDLVAEESGWLSDNLLLSDAITPSIAFDKTGREINPELSFLQSRPIREKMVLAQNFPNPATDQTRISFYIPQEGECSLKLLDHNGRMLIEHTAFYPRGNHTLDLDLSGLKAGGVYYYQLSSGQETASRSMLVVKP